MIRVIEKSDIKGLNILPPLDWQFDYEEFLLEFIDEEFFYGYVMIDGDDIIGTGNILLKDKVGWLANIIIVNEYRGKGLGSQMTQFLVDDLNSKGC